MANRCAALVSAICILTSLCCAPSDATEVNGSTEAAKVLFDDYWEAHLADFPEEATLAGDDRYSDRWHDLSAVAVAKRKALRLEFAKRLDAIPVDQLAGEDRLSYTVLRFQTKQKIEEDALFGSLPFSADDSPFAVTQMDGPQLKIPAILRATPFKTVHDYEMLLKRFDALPTHIDATIAQLRAGMQSRWMPAAVAIKRVPEQFAALLVPTLESNPLFLPFTKFSSDFVASDRARLQSEARVSIQTRVIPALAKLRTFMADEYIPAASKNIAASALPDGQAYYQSKLKAYTTTSMTAAQIHELGLKEVARIEKEMTLVMKEAGFTGSLKEFNTFMNTDPQFFFATADAMLMAYRDIAKRIDPRLPEQFIMLPRLPYGIRPMLPAEGDGPEHYTIGALDGSRAGYFEANVNNLKRRPSWTMESLVLHEAAPGHHLQFASASELSSLPKFRRAYWNSGYGEGWALYAESLGSDLGLYTTPYTRYGYLSSEIFRASRLVVDTGIHAFGMTRVDAIQYLMIHSAVTEAFATAEVDRYIVWPGQADSYKLGELKIRSLREQAHAKLGSRFDVRKFNNEIVNHGALPLDVLYDETQRWIATQH